MRDRWAAGLAHATLAILVAGCVPEIPSGVYVCGNDGDCPTGFSCVAGRCDEGCVPRDCGELRADCGLIDNGCGADIDCGTCSGSQVCGGSGIPNICGCEPAECTPGVSCGVTDDGCGGTIDCGACFGGFGCMGGMCACGGAADCTGRCGAIADGCGGIAFCPGCPPSQNCGGGGPSVCGTGTCTAASCQPGQCGLIPDGCGEVIDCGSCLDPAETCGAQIPSQCGCIPLTCDQLGYDCGSVEDPCSGLSMECGICPEPSTCGGGGVANVCGCPPRSCDGQCGAIADPCNTDMLLCPDCPDVQTCMLNECRCAEDTAEQNDSLPMGRGFPETPLGNGDTLSYLEFGIDGPRDEDWYLWPMDTATLAGVYNFRLDVQNIPDDANYDIELRPLCLALTQIVTCAPPAVPLERMLGCSSSTPGSADETIELSVRNCVLNGIAVGIKPVVFGATCSRYEMHLRLDISSAIP